MGRAKALWMEMESYDWEQTYFDFVCPSCSKETTATAEVPVVYEGMIEVDLPLSVRCDACSAEFSANITTNWDNSEILLDEFPETEIQAEPVRGFQDPPDIDWEYLYGPDGLDFGNSPYGLLIKTLDGISRLVEQADGVADRDIMLRMLLVQSVTALETFLGDTLQLEVSGKEESQKRLLMNNALGIGTTRVLLRETFGIENFAHQRLMQALKAVSYHNFKKVQKLYQCALSLDITPEADDLKIINNSILIRHDCVHRNGRSQDGEKINLIDRPQIEQLICSIRAMATRIDEKLSAVLASGS